jgi:N-acetylglucosaminyldiphosphoundecaprenol N-acetyl-beta-D-mannosaminyltransferase
MALPASAPDTLASIDGQTINIATINDVVKASIARLRDGLGFTLFTFNLDHAVKRRADPAFRAAYARATFVTADGAPIVWLANKQGARLDRVTGADLVIPMCEAAAREGVPVAFYGSSMNSLARAGANLRRMFPRLQINFMEAPPQGFDPTSDEADEAARRMAESGARICFVAFGAPKQEAFSDRMAGRHSNVGFLGIGAALDFIAGDQRRAPKFFQNNGLEWTWRLATNPRRMAVRYARCAAVLATLAVVPNARRAVSAGPSTR